MKLELVAADQFSDTQKESLKQLRATVYPAAVLARFLDRVRCLHLKDVDKKRLEEARHKRLDFYAAVRRGVFAPLGKGVVDFSGILQAIGKNGFDGWVVVEQDVLAGGRNATAPLDNAVAGRTFLKKLGV